MKKKGIARQIILSVAFINSFVDGMNELGAEMDKTTLSDAVDKLINLVGQMYGMDGEDDYNALWEEYGSTNIQCGLSIELLLNALERWEEGHDST